MDKYEKTYLNIISQQYPEDDQIYRKSQADAWQQKRAEYIYRGRITDIAYTFDGSNLPQFDNRHIIFLYGNDAKFTIQGEKVYDEDCGPYIDFYQDTGYLEFDKIKDFTIQITNSDDFTEQEKEKYIKIFKQKFMLDESDFLIEDIVEVSYDNTLENLTWSLYIKEDSDAFPYKDRYQQFDVYGS